MRRAVVLAMLMYCSMARAQDAGTAETKPTVHVVTPEERHAIEARCDTADTNAVAVRRRLKMYPGPEQSAQAAEYDRAAAACHATIEPAIEKLRVEGTEAERYQRQVAVERQAEHAAEAAEEAERQRIGAAPASLRLIFGAALCIDRDVRASALKEIATEKKYARVGGMINKAKMYKLQQRVRWADEHEAQDRKNLATHRGITAAPCSAIEVQNVIACRRADDCDNRIAKILATFVPDYEEDE